MQHISRLLCPVDFSEPSRHAAEHAIVVAGFYGARITALHVHSPVFLPVPGLALASPAVDPVLDAATRQQIEQDVRALFTPAEAAGVPVDVRVEVGVAIDRILECARGIDADLIVLGTHGAGGFQHLVLGSVTEKVLRKASCPVLTVPPRAQTTSALPFKRLLCPVDFSEPSKAALETALSIAQEADADLVILHVVEWPGPDEPHVFPPFDVPEYRVYRERDATGQIEALVPEDARNWCRPSIRVGHGKAYREILGAAAESSADLIVMGVHGRNALDVALFGSTTNQVVRRATCPVMTIRK
jgi:nucleotide-binding universal stress UspA family protein